MDRTLSIALTTHAQDRTFDVIVTDTETGSCMSSVDVPFSPDEHPEFDKALGNEIYSWITFMMEDESEN